MSHAGREVSLLEGITRSGGDLMSMGYNNVLKEAIVHEGDMHGGTCGLVVRGLWQPQTNG